jgi:hypothetical protein
MAAGWHGRAWYATDDDTILGIVLSARASDHRYSWLVLTSEDGLTIGIGSVRPTEEDATACGLRTVTKGGGRMNQEKIRRRLSTTPRACWSTPSMVRSNLHRAKAAIDMALDAMKSIEGWPREQDYE